MEQYLPGGQNNSWEKSDSAKHFLYGYCYLYR